jgi:hypothetical protein
LPKTTLELLKKFLKTNFFLVILLTEINWFQYFNKNGSVMDTYFLGYDDSIQREKMLYLNMLYDMIAYSINKGFKEIIFARTALEIKSSVGARPIQMYGYIGHTNPVVNVFMPKYFVI